MPRLGQVTKPLVKLGKDPEACWIWIGCTRGEDGLALKQIAGRQVPARRWLWEQLFGPIPDGIVIAQACGNQGCINPHHLRACTLAAAQRLGTNAVLNAADVRAIRAATTRTAATARALAAEHGCSPQTIRDIWRGDTWKSRTKSPVARTPSIRALEDQAA